MKYLKYKTKYIRLKQSQKNKLFNLLIYYFTYQGIQIGILMAQYPQEKSIFLIDYIDYGIKIATVEILDDARVYVESKKFKADKIIISNIILLKDYDKFTDTVFCKLAVKKNHHKSTNFLQKMC